MLAFAQKGDQSMMPAPKFPQYKTLIFETWQIDRCIGDARNPRKNDHAVDRVASAIREFGFRVPIVATAVINPISMSSPQFAVAYTQGTRRFSTAWIFYVVNRHWYLFARTD